MLSRDEARRSGSGMLADARALRAAFPDEAALRGVEIGPAPTGGEPPELAAAMKYLWDEMGLVRAGRAGTLAVLDDEIAHVESLLARL